MGGFQFFHILDNSCYFHNFLMMNKQIVVYAYNGKLFNCKNEKSTDTCHSVGKPGKDYAKWKKADIKCQYLCEICRIGKSIETESGQVFARRWGEGRIRSDCLVYTRFSFGMRNVWTLYRGGGCLTLWMYEMTLNCTLLNVNSMLHELYFNRKIKCVSNYQ